MEVEIPELRKLGGHLSAARQARGLSQTELAGRCALTQTQISYFELGRRQPSLAQTLQIARALDIPLQRLLTGSDRPETELKGLVIELRHYGINDLWVKGATVPGAFRRPEEVIALALSDLEPDPRIIEAIPAALAWNAINPTLLRAHGIVTRTTVRLAWLADVALTIERRKGFPGGCRKEPLERFIKAVKGLPPERADWDSLGKPMSHPPTSPLWKRWKIRYDATPDQFEDRARHLISLRAKRGVRRLLIGQSGDRQNSATEKGVPGDLLKPILEKIREKSSPTGPKPGATPKRISRGGGGK